MRVLGCALMLTLMLLSSAVDLASWAKRFPSGRTPTPGVSCGFALLKGPITVGDADKFGEFLRQNYPFLARVSLESAGGNVREAMKIGRMIREYLIQTEHENSGPWCNYGRTDCQCSSACFLIWAAGIERFGLHIGLHRPVPTDLAGMTPDRASATYRQAMTEIELYLSEMEVPPRYSQIMASTASSDVRWLSEGEIESMNEVPSISEWLAVACGGKTITHDWNSKYFDGKDYEKYVECRIARISRARDAIR